MALGMSKLSLNAKNRKVEFESKKILWANILWKKDFFQSWLGFENIEHPILSSKIFFTTKTTLLLFSFFL